MKTPEPALQERAAAFLPLTEATYLILVALAEPKHGYGIMQSVGALGPGGVRLGPGTLYGALTKLLAQGLIERRAEGEAASDRRKPYALTPLGRLVAELECDRLERMARAGRRLLRPRGGER